MTTLDAFTFEILRHRLWTINVEGALALQRVSGSPLATEAFDMNTSILSASGEVVFVGPYLLTGPMSQGMIVRSILAGPDGAAIERGDAFLCNDPYVGAAHQNCVTVVAPIHDQGALVAWAGATLHVVDVGGPTAGQVGIGARSIHDEPPVIGPVRILRRGIVDAQVERDYLGRSRTPELNALDLRAKLAAVRTIADRVGGVVATHGREALQAVLEDTIARAASHFRARLADLPDGSVHRSAFVDLVEDGEVSHLPIVLRLDKRGDRLVLDFRESSPQAPAIVNCTRSGLLSGVLVGLLTTLVWDAPWCPAAVERSVEVLSREGSVVDATWPAGCSMATMASGFAATTATAVATGELLVRSPSLRTRAMAAWAGAVGSVDVFGADAAGRRFGTVLLDTMASGAGATALADGVDTGGFLRSMACVVANVEQIEAQFPLLYLYRRQEPDTGGPGRHRGGVGVGYAVAPLGVEQIELVSPHFSGTAEPESLGLAGGYPGATNASWLVERAAGLSSTDGRGRSASDGRGLPGPDALAGAARPLPGVAAVSLGAADAIVVRATGGGGFGDPIEREPAAVREDVRAGLVTAATAHAVYGVVLDEADGLDGRATADLRRAIRVERLGRTGRPDAALDALAEPSDGWTLDETRAGLVVRCLRCGHAEPVADADRPLEALPGAIRPLAAAGPHAAPAGDRHLFGLRERYCPACARLLDVDRIRLAEDSPDA